MNEMTVLKIVDGTRMPRPSGFSGAIGCRHSTTKPKTNSIRLKMSSAIAYCFQSCGPLSSRRSNQPSHLRPAKRPSMTDMKYLLSGIDIAIVTASSSRGSVHIGFTRGSCERSWPRSQPEARRRALSEPLGPHERDAEVDEEQAGHDGGEVDHVSRPQIRAQASAKAMQASMLTAPSTNRAGNQMTRFMAHPNELSRGSATPRARRSRPPRPWRPVRW